MKLSPCNSIWKYFENKIILIIVPHQDDELFLCGTILGGIAKVASSVYVCFTTNGDFGCKFEKRKKDCFRALKLYGISKNNIIFLGYGDQYDTEYGHMYHAPKNKIVVSKAGFNKTYGTEFCMKKYGLHHDYTLDNFERDIKDVIESICPDILFCNDLDWHPDHRATSLVFDRVMGEILKDNRDYFPDIYKSFIYFLGWDGVLDYKRYNLWKTKKPHRYQNNDKRFEFGNPYFEWKDKICFPVDYELLKKRKNILYKSLYRYKTSKHAKMYYYSMMNSDAVFWSKCTQNYAINASISVSSGNSEFLNDFVIVDSNNINDAKYMLYDKSVWFPDEKDLTPTIVMQFEKIVAKQIVFYRDTYSYAHSSCELIIDIYGKINGVDFHENKKCLVDKYDIRTIVQLNENVVIRKLEINLSNNMIGFSEIEVVKEKKPKFIKISINGNYAYDYIITGSYKFLNIDVKTFGCSCDIEKKVIYLNGHILKENKLLEGNKLIINEQIKNCYLMAYVKGNPDIFDIVHIKKGIRER